jgi:hypothetical protein
MRIVLRTIAVLTGLAVALTGLFILQFALRGGLDVLVRSGALGVTTIGAWLVILTAGPFAAIQLWRLRRVGLFATAILCGLTCAYYVAGFLYFRAPEAPRRPIVEAIVVNGIFLALLLSPAARRRVS